jgi:hypothetical protein
MAAGLTDPIFGYREFIRLQVFADLDTDEAE